MLSLSVGPFALSIGRLLLLLVLAVALMVGWLYGRRQKISVEPVITHMLLLGLLSARIGFVLLYRDEYSQNLLGILDIRDGGFLVEAGLIVAACVGLYQGWRHPLLRRPLAASVTAGALAWLIGIGTLHLLEPRRPTLPDHTLVSIDGNQVSLSSLRGKPLVINLWATWCPPCIREMPVLAQAQTQLTDVEFLFVNQGESGTDISRYLETERLELRNVLLDPSLEMSRLLGSQAMPTTLFYTADGLLAGAHLGELSMATLKSNLEGLATFEE